MKLSKHSISLEKLVIAETLRYLLKRSSYHTKFHELHLQRNNYDITKITMLFKIIKIIISLCISKTKKAAKNQIEQLRENSMVFFQEIKVSL